MGTELNSAVLGLSAYCKDGSAPLHEGYRVARIALSSLSLVKNQNTGSHPVFYRVESAPLLSLGTSDLQ
jgi:hypothetical protein